jgi:FKBP-type peptidyl-prolyl cis-trans isomerase SlyD
MKVTKNCVVSINYTLKSDDGQEIDSSRERGPLSFIHGTGNIIPGLDNEMANKKVGDSFSTRISPENGYGLRDEGLIRKVDRKQLAEIEDLRVGSLIEASVGEDEYVVFSVVAMDDDLVTLDGNHPLAGCSLNFDVDVVAVREATAEELAHQHVHAGGCGC